jgi:6-phosphogluconolactonase (cycloisomerase 2 family)
VPDLGADRVWVYGFDAARGSLIGASNSMRHLVLPAGAGPRHLDFHPNGRWVYVLCELDGKVAQPPRHPGQSRLYCDCLAIRCAAQRRSCAARGTACRAR